MGGQWRVTAKGYSWLMAQQAERQHEAARVEREASTKGYEVFDCRDGHIVATVGTEAEAEAVIRTARSFGSSALDYDEIGSGWNSCLSIGGQVVSL